MEKPFVFGAWTSGSLFTDRQEDSKRLLNNFLFGINTIIISPRRWGKTSLVKNTVNKIDNKNVKVVFIDTYSCRTEENFYNTFATEVIKQTASKWEEWIENTKKFLSGIVPKISFSADSNIEYSISFDFSNKNTGKEVLLLPEKIAKEKNIKIVICIDEFQQIAEFKDSLTFQKTLRTVWQGQSEYVSFCLFGSKKHLLSQLFAKSNMPFYKFGDVILLSKIESKYWIPFIQDRFSKTGKSISTELSQKICDTVENHSYYVQQFAWLLWTRTESVADSSIFNDAYEDLLQQNSTLFFQYTDTLTEFQLNFLRAIANNITDNFMKQEILTKYHLGTSANVAKLKKSLQNKGILDITNKKVTFDDPVFKQWFKREFVLM